MLIHYGGNATAVSDANPLPVTSDDTVISNMPPISFEGGGGAETVVSDVNPLPVDCSEVEDVDDDNIAKSQVLPLKLNLPYVFSKTDDAWIRTQGSTDGYPFVRPIGIYDTAGHGLDINADGSLNIQAITNAIDGVTTAFKTIDYAHHEIHEGKHFKAGFQDTSMATDDVINLLFITPDSETYAHWVLKGQSTGAVVIELYEAPTTTANGTAVTVVNRDRNVVGTANTTLVYHTPTVTAVGTKLVEKWMGNEGFKESIGGEQRGDSELILKANTKYLVRLTAVSDGIKGAIGGDWYEHESVA